MSVFTECIGCLEQEVTLATLLRLTVLVDSDGSHYLNLKFNEKEQCDDYDPVPNCESPLSVENILKRLIVEDDCGYCAWNIVANICDACS